MSATANSHYDCESSGLAVECLTQDRRVAGSSLIGSIVLCP